MSHLSLVHISNRLTVCLLDEEISSRTDRFKNFHLMSPVCVGVDVDINVIRQHSAVTYAVSLGIIRMIISTSALNDDETRQTGDIK